MEKTELRNEIWRELEYHQINNQGVPAKGIIISPKMYHEFRMEDRYSTEAWYANEKKIFGVKAYVSSDCESIIVF